MRIFAISILILFSAVQITLGTPTLTHASLDTSMSFASTLRARFPRISPPASPSPTPTPQPTPTPTPPAPSPAPTPPPAPAPAPQPAPIPILDYATAAEQEILRLTNIERTKAGLSSLTNNSTLSTTARSHSADMLANNYFSHTNKSGCGADCRLQKAGFLYRSFGENIYTSWGRELLPSEAAAQVVAAWMKSTGHRNNILGSQFSVSGVGVAKGGTRLYVTAIYALPR